MNRFNGSNVSDGCFASSERPSSLTFLRLCGLYSYKNFDEKKPILLSKKIISTFVLVTSIQMGFYVFVVTLCEVTETKQMYPNVGRLIPDNRTKQDKNVFFSTEQVFVRTDDKKHM